MGNYQLECVQINEHIHITHIRMLGLVLEVTYEVKLITNRQVGTLLQLKMFLVVPVHEIAGTCRDRRPPCVL